jgi:hypothetical protein
VKDRHHKDDVNHDAHFDGDYHFWRDAATDETRANDDDASLRG